MTRPASLTLPLCFAIGALAGGAATAFLRHSPAAASARAHDSSPTHLARWDWSTSATPPPLAPDAAGTAIATWRAQRAPDGSALPYPVRADTLRVLLARLAPRDLPRLLATFDAKPEGDEARLRSLAFTIWTETDPEAATRWAHAAGEGATSLARSALNAWANRDPAAASAWACGLPSSPAAHQLAGLALSTLAEADLAHARSLVEGLAPDFRDAVMPALLKQLAKADPAAAVRAHAAATWKNGEGFYQMRDTLAAWAKQDPRAALEWLVAQPRQHSGMLGHWVGSLAQNPDEIHALSTAIASLPGLPDRPEMLADLLFSRGTDHPTETLAWLDSLGDSELRADVLTRLGQRHYTDNPEKTLPFALAQPASKNRNQNIGRLLSAWAKINPSAALDWIGQQTDPGVRNAALQVQGVLLADIAREEPELALAEWNALQDPRARQAAVAPILEAWGQKDPGAALRWATEQSGSGIYPRQELVYAWARQDPAAAVAWAEEFALGKPDQPHHQHFTDQIMASLAGTWQNRAPRAETADLYARIRDEKLRTRTLENHVREWLAADQAGARAWLESNTALSPEQAAKLLSAAK